jgi:TRAP-type C4-dicarboxylate transport system substrate-binding protein
MSKRGKVRVRCLISLLLGCFVLLSVLTSICEAQEPRVLRFSYGPPANSLVGQGYEFFAKAVKEESKGQIQVRTFPAGSLIPDHECLDGVLKGTVDMAHFFVAWISPTMKEVTPFEVPSAYPGNRIYELDKVTRPILDKIFLKYGIKYIGLDNAGTITFQATRRFGKVVTSPEDFKGHTVRTPGKWGGEAIKMWGGSPVAVTLADLPTALARGTIDVGYIGWPLASSLKLYESAPYVTVTDIPEFFRGIMMSNKAWKSLSESQQEAVYRSMRRWMDFDTQNASRLYKGFEKAVKDSGGTLYHLTKEQNEEFRKVREPLWEKIMPIAGAEGKELVEAVKTMR